MKKRVLLLVFIAAFVSLACGCVTPGAPESHPAPSPPQTVAPTLSLQINATPPRYNPAMSSTIGIRLEPVNTSGIIPPNAQFTWETPYGSFYHWGPPDFKVTELGAKYTGSGEPVYWSYFSEHGEKERRPVTLSLIVWDPSARTILANSSLGISWEDVPGYTAIVEGPG